MKVYKNVSSSIIEKIIDLCENKNIKNPDKQLTHIFKYNDVRINIYCNNTITLDGKEKDINKLVYLFDTKPEEKKIMKSSQVNINDSNIDGFVGCDEVGTGDYFGPVITCCCFLKKENIEKVKALHVDDSKKMNDETILKIYNKLIEYVNYTVVICDPKIYNDAIINWENSNIIKASLHNQGLARLVPKISNFKYKIVIDQFVNEKMYYSYLQKLQLEPIVKIDIFETKAEAKYLAVAVASVIARANFLEQMYLLSKKCNIVLPFGSSKTKEIVTVGKKICQDFALTDFAKVHFDSITKAIVK